MLSPSLNNNNNNNKKTNLPHFIQQIQKKKDGLASRRCSKHWRTIFKIKNKTFIVKWSGPLAGEDETNTRELPETIGRRDRKSVWRLFSCAAGGFISSWKWSTSWEIKESSTWRENPKTNKQNKTKWGVKMEQCVFTAGPSACKHAGERRCGQHCWCSLV